MSLPTWDEIEAFTDYDTLCTIFWQPVPAFDQDSRARVRRMAERMAALRPSLIPAYLPLPANHQPDPEPQTSQEKPAIAAPPPKPKSKPKPAPPKPADIDYFKSLFA